MIAIRVFITFSDDAVCVQILEGSIVVDVESSSVSLESDRLRIMREVTKQLYPLEEGQHISRRRLAYLKFNKIIREALVRSLKSKANTRRASPATHATSAAASGRTTPVSSWCRYQGAQIATVAGIFSMGAFYCSTPPVPPQAGGPLR
jgi:hypothetical protein